VSKNLFHSRLILQGSGNRKVSISKLGIILVTVTTLDKPVEGATLPEFVRATEIFSRNQEKIEQPAPATSPEPTRHLRLCPGTGYNDPIR
jgi:hypothetical protein